MYWFYCFGILFLYISNISLSSNSHSQMFLHISILTFLLRYWIHGKLSVCAWAISLKKTVSSKAKSCLSYLRQCWDEPFHPCWDLSCVNHVQVFACRQSCHGISCAVTSMWQIWKAVQLCLCYNYITTLNVMVTWTHNSYHSSRDPWGSLGKVTL